MLCCSRLALVQTYFPALPCRHTFHTFLPCTSCTARHVFLPCACVPFLPRLASPFRRAALYFPALNCPASRPECDNVRLDRSARCPSAGLPPSPKSVTQQVRSRFCWIAIVFTSLTRSDRSHQLHGLLDYRRRHKLNLIRPAASTSRRYRSVYCCVAAAHRCPGA